MTMTRTPKLALLACALAASACGRDQPLTLPGDPPPSAWFFDGGAGSEGGSTVCTAAVETEDGRVEYRIAPCEADAGSSPRPIAPDASTNPVEPSVVDAVPDKPPPPVDAEVVVEPEPEPLPVEPTLVELDWDDVGLKMQVNAFGRERWQLGLAQTGLGGDPYFGEDCVPGESSGLDVCHPIPADGNLRLLSVERRRSVRAGESTFVNRQTAAGLTYMLQNLNDPESCFTFGGEPEYYVEALGCELLGL
jgi:hypothetical protein